MIHNSTFTNHEIWATCPKCNRSFDRRLHGVICPDCGSLFNLKRALKVIGSMVLVLIVTFIFFGFAPVDSNTLRHDNRKAQHQIQSKFSHKKHAKKHKRHFKKYAYRRFRNRVGQGIIQYQSSISSGNDFIREQRNWGRRPMSHWPFNN